jgi:hypothetical protein
LAAAAATKAGLWRKRGDGAAGGGAAAAVKLRDGWALRVALVRGACEHGGVRCNHGGGCRRGRAGVGGGDGMHTFARRVGRE